MKASKTPTNPLRGLEDRPGFLIRRAHQISQSLFVEECAGLNITATQFGVLLEDRKLVRRSHDTNDRRRYLLRLTKAGEDLRLRALPPVDRVRTRLESVFTSAEAKTFSRLLDKFTRSHNDLRVR
jgi:hypothetical protein